MTRVALGEVASVNPTAPKVFSSAECAFVPMEAVNETNAEIQRKVIRPVSDVKKGYTYFENNDVLFAKITPCMENGKLAIAKNLENGFGFGSTEFHVIRASKDILPQWIFAFLRRQKTRDEAEKGMTGSAGQKRVPASLLERLVLPLPSLEEQRRIAGILERADRLRRLRLHALEISDTYLQSVFLEMFGDPSSNVKGWEYFTLRQLSTKFSDGPFGSNLKSEHYRLDGIRVWRLQNIGINTLIDDDKAFISSEHFQTISRHKCEPDDVIIGTMGDPNLRAFIQPRSIEIAVNKADCIQFRPNTKLVTGQYICQLMNMPQTLTLAGEMIHGQTRARISMGSLAELRIPLPPLELQRKFVRVVQRHERLRAQQLEGVRLAQGLYDALLHDAFADA